MNRVEKIQALLDGKEYFRKDGKFSYNSLIDSELRPTLEEAIYDIISDSEEWSITSDEIEGTTYISYAFVEVIEEYNYSTYEYYSECKEVPHLYHGVIHCVEE